MNLYPALRCRMGSWDYYVVKMSMRELAENVRFASEIYDDRTLDEAIQRTLNEKRVKGDIVTYLKVQRDRFFSSVVVAAKGGTPIFYDVQVTSDERFAVFRNDRRLNESFGVLQFDGTQKYYALDGQHRLAAIRTLLDRSDPLSEGAPKNFEAEEISVVVVVPKEDEDDDQFLRKYRRLFSSLNRYAKPTDQVTNIIMDEDDAFAIITRRLVSEHEFFAWAGRQQESRRVKTKKGKNLSTQDSYFTTLETLYEMNITMLSSRTRKNSGWTPEAQNRNDFKRLRPTDEYLDSIFDELLLYWNGILEEIPELSNEPSTMRTHTLAPEGEDDKGTDHLLFWPIGQEMLATIVREALDSRRMPNPDQPDKGSVAAALKGLGMLEWRLHEPPWRFFLLTRDPVKADRWKMRSEDRAEVVRIGRRVQEWVLGLDELDEAGVAELKVVWESRLIPPQTEAEQNRMWSQVIAKRSEINASLTGGTRS